MIKDRYSTQNRGESLCWWCRNAVPRKDKQGDYTCGCLWSIYKVPVPGWNALLDWKQCQGFSYLVTYCPKYENDAVPYMNSLKTDQLFRINYDEYGVDIFPGCTIYKKRNKRERIRKPWMTEEQYLAEKRRLKALYQKQWMNRNKERYNAKARERYREKTEGNVRRIEKIGNPYGMYSGRTKEYKRMYYETHKEQFREYQRRHRKKMMEQKNGDEQID